MVSSIKISSVEQKSQIIEFCCNKIVPRSAKKYNFIRKARNFKVIEGVLFCTQGGKELQVLVPEEVEEVNEAIRRIHEPGHIGSKTLWREFKEKYCGIPRTFIEEYVKKCYSCILNTPLKDTDVVKNITASSTMERFQIDLIDLKKYKEQNDQFSWILHVIDVYSRYSFVFPLRLKSAIEVRQFLFNFKSFRLKMHLKRCFLLKVLPL